MKLDRMKQYQEKCYKIKKNNEIRIITVLKDKWTSNNGYFGKELPKKRNEKAHQRKNVGHM